MKNRQTKLCHPIAICSTFQGYTVFATVISGDTDGAKTLQKEFKERMFIVPMNVTSDEDVIKGMEIVKQNLPAGSAGQLVISTILWY